MKIYIKELGKNENIQVLNTSGDKFFMPRIGDSILVSYTVIKIDWVSFRSGNESAILWVIKKENNFVKVSIIKKQKFGLWKTREQQLVETKIERTQFSEALVPRLGELMEVEGKTYKVLSITKVGSLFNFKELKVAVEEV